MSKEFVKNLVGDYVDRLDWRVLENSNSGYSFASLNNHISGSVIANYTLDNVYNEEIANLHRNGDIHIHDLSCGIVPYCSGWSLRQILEVGFKGKEGRASAKPAKHFDTILLQLVNFIGTLQTEFAGAMAISSLDVLLAPFIRSDNLSYTQVKQNMQQFVFGLNIASRFGQCAFSNVSFDLSCPPDLKDHPVIIGGKLIEGTKYSDYQKEIDMINKAFLEIMAEGDADGKLFSFPIPTYNITDDFKWESEISNLLFAVTAKYGLPYFQNFINSDLNPEDVRSMCCRLQIDLRELEKKTGGIFGAGEKTGSIGVITLNMPRIGYKSENKDELFDNIEYLMDNAQKSLEIKRKLVSENLKKGLLPYTSIYLDSFRTYFSTIGLVGMNELCLNFIGKNIGHKQGKKLSLEILDFMRSKLSDYQQETGNIYNLESSPAEATAYRLAMIDKRKYPQITTSGDIEPYYTNSTNLPVGYTSDLFKALDKQDELQCKYTGGTVFHAYIEDVIESENAKLLVRKTFENYKLPYMSITPTFSICDDHGYFAGSYKNCPECGKEATQYSRVTGYIRPVKNYNKGKKQEFFDRKTYKVK